MTSERSKRRDFLSLIFIAKSISKKLLIKFLFVGKLFMMIQLTKRWSTNNDIPYSCYTLPLHALKD